MLLLLPHRVTDMLQDGKLMKKRNTFVDFIAAAEHLIKVCSPPPLMTRCMSVRARHQHAVKVERSVQRDNCHRRKVLSSRTAAHTAGPASARRRPRLGAAVHLPCTACSPL